MNVRRVYTNCIFHTNLLLLFESNDFKISTFVHSHTMRISHFTVTGSASSSLTGPGIELGPLFQSNSAEATGRMQREEVDYP